MTNEIIEKIKKRIKTIDKLIETSTIYHDIRLIESKKRLLQDLLPDLESAQQTQNELIEFILQNKKCICEYCLNVFEKENCESCIIYKQEAIINEKDN